MNLNGCEEKSREIIPEDLKSKLLKKCNFACSICGSIPVVFHHIEHWEKPRNEEEFLIPICPNHHAEIHGEGGPRLSKHEQYYYKNNPKKPIFLSHTLSFVEPRSFFVGNNFISYGNNILLFNLPNNCQLLSFNLEENIFRMSILAEAFNGTKNYLIKDNELTIDTEVIWDMRYSGPRLQIKKKTNGKEIIFIDLNLHEDAVIIREMNTTFNNIPFQVYKLRTPQKRQIEKIERQVKELEKKFLRISEKIDGEKVSGKLFGGIDVGELKAKIQKQDIKHRMQRWLNIVFCKEFNWDLNYYHHFLRKILAESSIFQEESLKNYDGTNETVTKIKAKYKKEFDELENVVVKYGNNIWEQNFYITANPM